jgi:chitosanase
MIKNVCEQLTSIFENGTPEIQYDYVSSLNDGRGITCGKAGFTTGGDDALEVIELYTKAVPDNGLKKYIHILANTGGENTSLLKDFGKDWKEACKDKKFLLCQDKVTDRLYWIPSQKYIKRKGLTYNLSKAVLYDTIIQHGEGNDPDSFGAIFSHTNAFVKSYLKEENWLRVFLLYRERILSHSFNKESREVWAESTGRCETFLRLVEEKNFNLETPFKINWENQEYIIKE